MADKTQSELAAEQREKIKSNVPAETVEKETNDKNNDAEGEVADEEANEEANDESGEEGEEVAEEGSKEAVEGAEAAETDDVKKLKKTIERLQRRVDKKTGSEATLRTELKTAKAALEAKQAEGEVVLTDEEVERRANLKADEKVAAKEFTRACNRLLDEAVKVDKKFETKIAALAEDIGEIPSQMIGILDDLDNGGAVLAHLANNDDEAEAIWSLPLAKMTLRLAKLSDKLETEAKAAKKKPISQVPSPNEPIGGGGVQPKFDAANTKMSTKEWIEKRNKQVADQRAAKLASYR